MANELSLMTSGGAALPAYLQNQTSTLNDSLKFGSTIKRISTDNGMIVTQEGDTKSQGFPFIDVVIIDAAPKGRETYRQYYDQQWQRGAKIAPACFSEDGIVPSPLAKKKQCDTCAKCPRNVMGKSLTGGRECGFSKHLVVADAHNMDDLYQVRIGGTSLFDKKLGKNPHATAFGLGLFTTWLDERYKASIDCVVARISLSAGTNFGYTFSAAEWLSEEQMHKRDEIRETRREEINRLLSNAIVSQQDDEPEEYDTPAAPPAPAPAPTLKERAAMDARLPQEVKDWIAHPAVTEQQVVEYLTANYPHVL